MMGERTVAQEALFYSFNLDRHVPADHLLRSIDRFVDLSGIPEHLRPFYSSTGRPSVDPELMIRMLIIGYCMGIRSERRLCEEVHVNLAYRWFCRLGLEGDVPDHSTFSKNRHGRFRDSDLLRQLFETTVARCIAEGLVGGEGFAVDGSLVRADVNRQHAVGSADALPDATTSHAVREYLAVLDDAAFGGATPVPPKQLAVADPAARWTAASRERAFFAYATNYLIDLQHAVIVDVEATTAAMTPSSVPTSPSTMRMTATSALQASGSARGRKSIARSGPSSMSTACCATAPASWTVKPALSSNAVVPSSQRARSFVQSTRAPVIWRAMAKLIPMPATQPPHKRGRSLRAASGSTTAPISPPGFSTQSGGLLSLSAAQIHSTLTL